MSFFKKLFGKKEENTPREFTPEDYENYQKLKEAGIENILGKMHGMVGHAIIPFFLGGNVDVYYFLNHIQGVGFATMELLDPDGNGPIPNNLGTYELVAFTKNNYSEEPDSAFKQSEQQICNIFTTLAFYSKQAILNPKETCEIPAGEGEESICLIFDEYSPDDKKLEIGDKKHHLLLCMQVFRNEMEFAMENGTGELINKLKEADYYPYSDLNRDPVI